MSSNASPDPIDVHVGMRVRIRRKQLSISQLELGEAVGIAFQQIQKYERGWNRISASRLFKIAQKLEVGVAYFFNDLADNPEGEGDPLADAQAIAVAFAVPAIRAISKLSRPQQLALETLIAGLAANVTTTEDDD